MLPSGTFYDHAVIENNGFHQHTSSSKAYELFESGYISLLVEFLKHILYLQGHDKIQGSRDYSEFLPIKLEIIKGKHWHETSEPPSSADIRKFAGEIIYLIQLVIQDESSCDQNWRSLKRAVLQQFHKKCFVSLAFELCSQDKVETEHRVEDNLRFALIERLLSEAEDPEDDILIDRLGMCLGIWRTDPEESIRMRVERIIDFLSSC
ncbi:hypothetical protein F5Y02DRAFT_102762 [Annulohypoxylon stygium]|nr:hypothetical protein F5Y02DRAFT_102762 [Annulohypoxylon stygium]